MSQSRCDDPLIRHRGTLDYGNRRVRWIGRTITFALWACCEQGLENLHNPSHAHKDNESASAFVAREHNVLALPPDSRAYDKRFRSAALRDRDSRTNGTRKRRTDARDDDRLVTPFAEIEYLLADTPVY